MSKFFNNKNTFFAFQKCFGFLFFFFCNVFCFFAAVFSDFFLTQYRQYLNVLILLQCCPFLTTILIHLLFVLVINCFNTTLFPNFFCDFYNNLYILHKEKINFFDEGNCLIIFGWFSLNFLF